LHRDIPRLDILDMIVLGRRLDEGGHPSGILRRRRDKPSVRSRRVKCTARPAALRITASPLWVGVLVLGLLSCAPVRAEELRGIRFELPGLFAVASPEQIVSNVASIRFNAILCTVRPEMTTDPRFRELLSRARSRGIAVHAVLSTMVPGWTASVPAGTEADTLAVNSSGRRVSEWLCPSRPRVRGWAVELACALARLGVDGVQLDYIRFGGPDLCFCDLCKKNSAAWLPSHPGRTWEDWRDAVITSLAGEVRDAIRAVNPKIQFSCSTWTVGEGQRRTYLTPEGEGYGWRQGQDFTGLAAITEFLRPMLYSCMLREDAGWIVRMAGLAVRNAGGKAGIVVGVALTIEEEWKQCQLPRGELRKIVKGIRGSGALGLAIWGYPSLFDPRYKDLGFLDEVRALFP